MGTCSAHAPTQMNRNSPRRFGLAQASSLLNFTGSARASFAKFSLPSLTRVSSTSMPRTSPATHSWSSSAASATVRNPEPEPTSSTRKRPSVGVPSLINVASACRQKRCVTGLDMATVLCSLAPMVGQLCAYGSHPSGT